MASRAMDSMPEQPRARRARKIGWQRPAVHLAAALPLLWLAAAWAELLFVNPVAMRLSAEPVAYSQNFTGLWAFRLLLLSLLASPLQKLLRDGTLLKYRRALGLWAFGYAAVHFLLWFGLDVQFGFAEMVKAVVQKPFILLGMAALLLLLPLAATSTRAAQKWLGGRRWQWLHRSVYVAGIAVAVHFVLRVKGWQPEPLIYAATLILLLGIRLLPRGLRLR
jgi:methionine sulfoxide reductase heme-binding subunit